jgi:hypothetical protein
MKAKRAEAIYGMPSFPMLTVLGFRDVFSFRMPDNRPVLSFCTRSKADSVKQ